MDGAREDDPYAIEPETDAEQRRRDYLAFQQRLDGVVVRGASMLLGMVMLGALAQLASLALMTEVPWSGRIARMGTGGAVFLISLMSFALARIYSVRIAAAFFCTTTLVALFGFAIFYGNGLHSSAMPGVAVLIVILGFMVGRTAAKWATGGAMFGFILLWQLEAHGLIGGLNVKNYPPLASYAVVYTAAALLTGWMVQRYGTLFWDVTTSLESSRRLLAETVKAQQGAVQELRDSEERMRHLLDSSLTSIQILDGETGALRFANAQTLVMYGCSRLSELDASLMYPGGPYSREVAMQWVRRTVQEGAQYYQWQSRRLDGQLIWWDMKLDRMQLGDEVGVVAFCHDITSRMQAEAELQIHRMRLEDEVRARTAELMAEKQRMQDILEALPITLSIRDPQGRFTMVNRMFEQSYGLNSETVLGRTAHEFFPVELASELADIDAQVLAELSGRTFERQIAHPKEGWHDYLITTVPLVDTRRQPYAVLNLGADVTPLKRLQRDLSLAKDEAERLARVKSDFLANMSHEIRTPLNAVLGLAQLGVARAGDVQSSRSSFERIVRAGRHLLSVINDILDYSKIESGKLDIDCMPCNLNQLVREVLDLVSERADAKHLRVRMNYDIGIDWVELDALRVTQILVNLMSNAIKFTEKGRVTLGVEKHGERLLLSVTDTGVGIAPEQQQRIFKAFEQADTSTTRQFGGTGLGLSISRQLAQLMGGDITVSSTLGVGSCFTLDLPLVETSEVQPQAVTAGPGLGPDPLRGLNILITDDVDINREILHDILVGEGATVLVADGGAQAIEHLKDHGQQGIDLALMDVQMPDMDGYETTRRLHELAPQLPVIALTAHALPEERRKCLAAGMVGHVTKPIDQAELIQALLAQAVGIPRRKPKSAAPAKIVMPPMPSSLPASMASSDLPLERGPKGLPSPAAAGVPAAPPDRGAAVPDPSRTAPGDAGSRPAPAPWPDIQGANFEAALTRCAGKKDLLVKLLGTFAKQYSAHQQMFDEAQAAGMSTLCSAAHRLKGLGGNLGLDAISALAAVLERAAGPNGSEPDVAPAMTALNAALVPALVAIADWQRLREQPSP